MFLSYYNHQNVLFNLAASNWKRVLRFLQSVDASSHMIQTSSGNVSLSILSLFYLCYYLLLFAFLVMYDYQSLLTCLLLFIVSSRCRLGREGITHYWSMVPQFTLVVPVCVVFLVMVLKQHNVYLLHASISPLLHKLPKFLPPTTTLLLWCNLERFAF